MPFVPVYINVNNGNAQYLSWVELQFVAVLLNLLFKDDEDTSCIAGKVICYGMVTWGLETLFTVVQIIKTGVYRNI